MDQPPEIAQTPSASKRKVKRWPFLRRFKRSETGTAAVEFAIIAIPFIAMLFAIIETALVLFATQVIETAVADASRLIMTGQAQTQNMSGAQFKAVLCDRMGGMFDCAGGVKVDVRNYSDFNSAQNSRPVNNGGQLDTSGFGYSPGGSGAIVVVRAVYEWPVFVSRLGMNLADQTNGKRLLIGTAVFKNEPFN